MSKNQDLNKKKLLICVPARLASTRLPQKMLRKIGKQTMIEHVCDRVLELLRLLRSEDILSEFRFEAVVLSDSLLILDLASAKGLGVVLSKKEHENGTSRIQEYLEDQVLSENGDLVLNIQGDEPFLHITDVVELLKGFSQSDTASFVIGTLAFRNKDFNQFLNPSCVKVVIGSGGQALYFSRAPVPWPRSLLGTESVVGRQLQVPADLPLEWSFWHHLGIYVYRAKYLLAYNREGRPQGGAVSEADFLVNKLKAWPQALDAIEGLEQLAVLASGKKIWVKEAMRKSIGIDTEADLAFARAWHTSQQND